MGKVNFRHYPVLPLCCKEVRWIYHLLSSKGRKRASYFFSTWCFIVVEWIPHSWYGFKTYFFTHWPTLRPPYVVLFIFMLPYVCFLSFFCCNQLRILYCSAALDCINMAKIGESFLWAVVSCQDEEHKGTGKRNIEPIVFSSFLVTVNSAKFSTLNESLTVLGRWNNVLLIRIKASF